MLQHLLTVLSLEAMSHPRCVGWGEIGLDYHYDNSPRDKQQEIFARQLRHAVRLGKPLTIHTREAEDDTERILKEVVPKDHKVCVHPASPAAHYVDSGAIRYTYIATQTPRIGPRTCSITSRTCTLALQVRSCTPGPVLARPL